MEKVAGNATEAVGKASDVLAGATAPTASGNATEALAGKAAEATASLPPVMADSAFTWGGYFQAIAVLLLLLALLWAAVWLARKYGKFNFMPQPGAFPRDSLRVEAQVPLGPRKGLVVVRFLNKRILLGVTDQQITYLTEAGHHNEQEHTDFQGLMEEAQCQKSDVPADS